MRAHTSRTVNDDHHAYRRSIIDCLYGQHLLIQRVFHILTVIRIRDSLSRRSIRFISTHRKKAASEFINIAVQNFVKASRHICVRDIDENYLVVFPQFVHRFGNSVALQNIDDVYVIALFKNTLQLRRFVFISLYNQNIVEYFEIDIRIKGIVLRKRIFVRLYGEADFM